MPPQDAVPAVRNPPSSPGTSIQETKPQASWGDRILFSIASSGITAGAMAGLQPEMVQRWIAVVQDAGMPGTILFLLGYIFYLEFRKLAAREDKHEQARELQVARYDRLLEAYDRYRDSIAGKSEAAAESRVAATAQLAASLDRLTETVEDLAKRGASRNGV